MKNCIILLLTLFLFASCQKEATSNLSLIENQLKTDNTSSSEFILKNDTILKGKLGTVIFIPKDLFANYTNGKITLKLKEYFNKEDMILNGLSTITDKDELLESSGMIYINFTEEGKQLTIKEGKRYKAQLPNKILANSNLYSNANDSIFKWEFMEPILRQKDTTISDVVKNYQFGIKTGVNGKGGFFRDVVLTEINTIAKIRKEDSLEISKLKKRKTKEQIAVETNMDEFEFVDIVYDEYAYIKNDTALSEEQKLNTINQKEIQRGDFYNKSNEVDAFTSSKLGWINCDKLLNIEKEVTLQLTLKDHKKITDFSLYYIYKEYKTFLKESYITTPSLNRPFKVSGRTKVVVVSNANENYLFDVFYVNKNSKTNFDIKLKETSLENLKKVLVSE